MCFDQSIILLVWMSKIGSFSNYQNDDIKSSLCSSTWSSLGTSFTTNLSWFSCTNVIKKLYAQLLLLFAFNLLDHYHHSTNIIFLDYYLSSLIFYFNFFIDLVTYHLIFTQLFFVHQSSLSHSNSCFFFT